MRTYVDLTMKAHDQGCFHCTLRTKAVGSLIGIIAGFVIVVAIETAFVETPPILIGGEEVVGFNRADDLILDYRRNLGAYHEFFAIRTVRVTCNGISYSTPDSIHYYREENPKPARTYYVLPNFSQEEGTKCTMHRTLIWKPNFSLQDKTFLLPKLDFKVVTQQKAM
ncbi:hypothetical protein CCP4SC76_6750009 [Gammaproteobacteria bacterium]